MKQKSVTSKVLGSAAMTIRIALLLALCGGMSACASFERSRVGLTPEHSLFDCPSAPRCVSSLALDPAKRVPPIQLIDKQDGTWAAVAAVLGTLERTQLVERSNQYLRAEVTSPWGVYTDDVELLRDQTSSRIEIRSTARIGYYDFGVNRERVDMIRSKLMALGLLSHSD